MRTVCRVRIRRAGVYRRGSRLGNRLLNGRRLGSRWLGNRRIGALWSRLGGGGRLCRAVGSYRLRARDIRTLHSSRLRGRVCRRLLDGSRLLDNRNLGRRLLHGLLDRRGRLLGRNGLHRLCRTALQEQGDGKPQQ